MTWKTILKVDMEEARRLGDKYAPEEMMQARTDKVIADAKAMLPVMENIVELIENTDDEKKLDRLYQSLIMLYAKVGGSKGKMRPIYRSRMERPKFLAAVKDFIEKIGRME